MLSLKLDCYEANTDQLVRNGFTRMIDTNAVPEGIRARKAELLYAIDVDNVAGSPSDVSSVKCQFVQS